MGAVVRAMTLADYDEAIALWRSCEGLGLSAADEREPIARFLERNSGQRFVAYDGDERVELRVCSRALGAGE